MQGRHRNHSPNDGFRPGYRSRCRGRSGSSGVGCRGEPYLSPPPPRKEDILIEAGWLAAEYLAHKGLLLSDSPSPKTDCREFKGRDRDSLSGADGRDSTFNRLRFDAGNGRRRYEDEYGRNGFRGRKRYSPDWGRDNERWTSRNRGGYFGSVEEEDDYSPRYRRDRRSTLDHVLPRSEVDRRSWFDHMLPRSEQTSDSGSENHDVAEDTGSKASSSGTRRKPPINPEMNFGKVREGGQQVSFENADEVSGNSKKKILVEEHSEVVGGEDKCNSGLMRGFPNVSNKQRTSVLQKNAMIDQEVTMEESNTAEAVSGEDPKEGSLTDLLKNETNILKAQTNDTSTAIPTQPIEKCVNLGQKSILTPAIVTEGELMIRREGVRKRSESSAEDEDECFRQDNLRAEQSDPKDEMYVMEEAKVAPVAVAQEKSDKNTSFPESEPEEEKQIIPNSFKNFDLNLTSTPETTEISDDSFFLNHLHSPVPRLDTGKETSMDFDLSVGSHNNGTHDYSQLPSHDKMVQVIDLEDDSHVEDNRCGPSKLKDESTIHPNLGNFLSHTGHVDLPGIQDGYAPALSEFLGNDLSHCLSVSSDLHNPQARVGLHDAEGVPNDDDSIYVSLGEIPIGFMAVWDQPPPDYGKLF